MKFWLWSPGPEGVQRQKVLCDRGRVLVPLSDLNIQLHQDPKVGFEIILFCSTAVFQTQCSGLWEPRAMEPRLCVPEPHIRRHSGQGRMKALEWNWMWQAAKQGKAGWDKDLIRVQTENSSEQQAEALFQSSRPGRTSEGGGGGHTGPWRIKKPANQLPQCRSQSRAPFCSLLGKPSWTLRQFYLLWILLAHLNTFLPQLTLMESLPCAQCWGFAPIHAQSILQSPPLGGCCLPHFIAKETEAQFKW